MMYIVPHNHSEVPVWPEEKRIWKAVCEIVTQSMHFMLTLDEFATIFNQKYPEAPESIESLRAQHLQQYYTEKAGKKSKFKDLEKRDTPLTLVSDGKAEWLAHCTVENHHELFEKYKELFSGKRDFYIPTVEEAQDFVKHGFIPSNHAILAAYTTLSGLIGDDQAGTLIALATNGFARSLGFQQVLSMIFQNWHFEENDKYSVLLALREVFNNTHISTNRGFTPLEMLARKTAEKQDKAPASDKPKPPILF